MFDFGTGSRGLLEGLRGSEALNGHEILCSGKILLVPTRAQAKLHKRRSGKWVLGEPQVASATSSKPASNSQPAQPLPPEVRYDDFDAEEDAAAAMHGHCGAADDAGAASGLVSSIRAETPAEAASEQQSSVCSIEASMRKKRAEDQTAEEAGAESCTDSSMRKERAAEFAAEEEGEECSIDASMRKENSGRPGSSNDHCSLIEVHSNDESMREERATAELYTDKWTLQARHLEPSLIPGTWSKAIVLDPTDAFLEQDVQVAFSPDKGASSDMPEKSTEGNRMALLVETFNATSTRTLKKRLMSSVSDVMLCQEHGVLPADRQDFEHWCSIRGWKVILNSAIVMAHGAASCGVAVFAREAFGLRPSEAMTSCPVLERPRVLRAFLDIPGWHPVGLTTAYLRTGEGLSAGNKATLAQICRLVSERKSSIEITAGDWNMTADQLSESGIMRALEMQAMLPAQPTCIMANSSSTIDFFLGCRGAQLLAEEVRTDTTWPKRPHRPVLLCIRPDAEQLTRLVIRAPPMLPVQAPFGPRTPPADWTCAKSLASLASDMAATQPIGEVQVVLREAYKAFANTAEIELADATGTKLHRYGTRGGFLTLQYEHIVQRNHLPDNEEAVHQGWSALYSWTLTLQHALRREETPEEGVRGEDISHHTGEVPESIAVELSNTLYEATAYANTLLHSVALSRQDLSVEVYLFLSQIHEHLEISRRSAQEAEYFTWEAFIEESCRKGMKALFAISKPKGGWQPTIVAFEGKPSNTEAAVLQAEASKLARLWQSTEIPGAVLCPDRLAHPLAPIAKIRAASNAFSSSTSVAGDGFHPTHFALLSDQGLSTLACLFQAIERIGIFPEQVYWLCFPLIGKPQGGVRPIIAQSGMVRLWEALRYDVVNSFVASVQRPYWADGQKRGAESAVFVQGIRAEAQVNQGNFVGAFFWDGFKFYESFDLARLNSEFREFGGDPVVAKVTHNLWRGPRFVRLSKAVHSRPSYAICGLPAGSKFNTAFVRAFAVKAFDRYTHLHPQVSFSSMVDDVSSAVSGSTRDSVVTQLNDAATTLQTIYHEVLQIGISFDKVSTTASDPRLATMIVQNLKALGGEAMASVPNLGVDYTPGRRRLGSKFKSRRAGMYRRGTKLAKLRRWMRKGKHRIFRLHTAGLRPAATFGAAVNGYTDSQLQAGRRCVLRGQAPGDRGVSMTLRLVAFGDPLWRESVMPAIEWSRQVWHALTEPAYALCSIRELVDAWTSSQPDPSRSWLSTRGPMDRIAKSLVRINWKVISPVEWLNDLLQPVHLGKHSPSLIGHMLQEAVQRLHERRAARKLGSEEFGERVSCAIPAALWRSKKGEAQHKHILKAATCQALWTRDRAQAGGYLPPSLTCPLCGQADGLFHRIWQCSAPAVAAIRAKYASQATIALALHDPHLLQWTTGLAPLPEWPAPSSITGLVIKNAAGVEVSLADVVFDQGVVVGDGSASREQIPELNRASFALAWLRDDDLSVVFSVQGAVPAMYPQTSQAAENLAPALASDLAVGPWTYFGDCWGVIESMGKTAREQVKHSKKYAGVRRFALAQFGNREFQTAVHQKAHQSDTTILSIPDHDERTLAWTNKLVDALAKEALVLCHPQPSAQQVNDTNLAMKRQREVCRTIQHVLAEFPPEEHKLARVPVAEPLPQEELLQARKLKALTMEQAKQVSHPHQWLRCQGHADQWWCVACLRHQTGSTCSPSFTAAGPCTPSVVVAKILLQGSLGHQLFAGQTTKGNKGSNTRSPLTLLWCGNCGCVAERRLESLAKECLGVASYRGQDNLGRLLLGRHPRGYGGPSRNEDLVTGAWRFL